MSTTAPQSKVRRQFASDNNAGICPEVWAALKQVNVGHAVGYGDDAWTAKAKEMVRDVFETDCEVFFVFNGTAANSLVLASMCDSYHSVICYDYSHVETDECGAPGFFAHGTKMHPLSGNNGKIEPPAIEEAVKKRRDVHASKPRVVSLTQATELGTVYSPQELAAISKLARELDLFVHIDGARFANAVAELNVSPRKITWETGVDALCFGGTKNGMAFGDAVVFFNHDLAKEFLYRCKQAGQLASKMRFLAAQWIGLLQDGAWLRNAAQANRVAKLLESKLRDISGVRILYPRQANAVFLQMPARMVEGLHKRGWRFYSDVGPSGARLMCSWDSTEDDALSFVNDMRDLSK